MSFDLTDPRVTEPEDPSNVFCLRYCQDRPLRDVVFGTSRFCLDLCAALQLPINVAATSLFFLQRFMSDIDVSRLERPLICGACVLLSWKFWEDFDEIRSVRKLNSICRSVFQLLSCPVEDSEEDEPSQLLLRKELTMSQVGGRRSSALPHSSSAPPHSLSSGTSRAPPQSPSSIPSQTTSSRAGATSSGQTSVLTKIPKISAPSSSTHVSTPVSATVSTSVAHASHGSAHVSAHSDEQKVAANVKETGSKRGSLDKKFEDAASEATGPAQAAFLNSRRQDPPKVSHWRKYLEPLTASTWTLRDEGREFGRVKERMKLFETALLRCLDFEVGPISLPFEELESIARMVWLLEISEDPEQKDPIRAMPDHSKPDNPMPDGLRLGEPQSGKSKSQNPKSPKSSLGVSKLRKSNEPMEHAGVPTINDSTAEDTVIEPSKMKSPRIDSPKIPASRIDEPRIETRIETRIEESSEVEELKTEKPATDEAAVDQANGHNAAEETGNEGEASCRQKRNRSENSEDVQSKNTQKNAEFEGIEGEKVQTDTASPPRKRMSNTATSPPTATSIPYLQGLSAPIPANSAASAAMPAAATPVSLPPIPASIPAAYTPTASTASPHPTAHPKPSTAASTAILPLSTATVVAAETPAPVAQTPAVAIGICVPCGGPTEASTAAPTAAVISQVGRGASLGQSNSPPTDMPDTAVEGSVCLGVSPLDASLAPDLATSSPPDLQTVNKLDESRNSVNPDTLSDVLEPSEQVAAASPTPVATPDPVVDRESNVEQESLLLDSLLDLSKGLVLDFYRSPFCLLCDPQKIASAAVWKAAVALGFKKPFIASESSNDSSEDGFLELFNISGNELDYLLAQFRLVYGWMRAEQHA